MYCMPLAFGGLETRRDLFAVGLFLYFQTALKKEEICLLLRSVVKYDCRNLLSGEF